MCANEKLFNGSERQESHTSASKTATPANGVRYKHANMRNSILYGSHTLILVFKYLLTF
jgi:hypothetical protein